MTDLDLFESLLNCATVEDLHAKTVAITKNRIFAAIGGTHTRAVMAAIRTCAGCAAAVWSSVMAGGAAGSSGKSFGFWPAFACCCRYKHWQHRRSLAWRLPAASLFSLQFKFALCT